MSATGRSMRHGVTLLALGIATSFGLAACGEKPQVAAATGERKTDAKGYTGAAADFTAPGWKAGDEASWQQQLKQRAQSQNEYVRVGAKKSGS
jgi:hypothetical protein